MPLRFQASIISSEQLVPFRAIRMQEWPDRKGEVASAWCHGCLRNFHSSSWRTAPRESVLKHSLEDRGCEFLNSQTLGERIPRGREAGVSRIRTKVFFSGVNCVVKILPIAGKLRLQNDFNTRLLVARSFPFPIPYHRTLPRLLPPQLLQAVVRQQNQP